MSTLFMLHDLDELMEGESPLFDPDVTRAISRYSWNRVSYLESVFLPTTMQIVRGKISS
jgi:hypothetical protein